MESCPKEDIHGWIHQFMKHHYFNPPSDELCDHIATCDSCKGALLLLLIDMLDVPLPAFYATGQRCEDDLAAYIDLEIDAGMRTAIQEYPHVWWHLWTSPNFAETYRLTRDLVKAEHHGELPPLSVSGYAPKKSIPRIFPQLRLSSSFLKHIIATRYLSGAIRGADNDEWILIEENSEGYMLSMSVQPQCDNTWNVIVTVKPPVSGSVVLKRGETERAAQFNSQGMAIIASVPRALLTADDDSDLVIHIYAEDESL